MAKTGKLLGIMAVFGALIGGGAASTSIQAQAQTLPAMKISKLNYQSTSKNLSFTAKTSADVSKIAVEYKGKTTYFKAKKKLARQSLTNSLATAISRCTAQPAKKSPLHQSRNDHEQTIRHGRSTGLQRDPHNCRLHVKRLRISG